MEISAKVHDFLNRELPGMVAVIGTNGADGMPHLVPVWYRWDGELIHIWTLESRVWVQNLVRDTRVGFSVQEEADPYMAVMMKGHATIETGDHPEIHGEIRRITRRYVVESEIENYIESWPGLRTMVHIKPESVLYRND